MARHPEIMNKVLRTLRKEILSGQLTGKIESKIKLAKRLGASVDTINKATLQLQAEGLIVENKIKNIATRQYASARLGDKLPFDKQLKQRGLTPYRQDLSVDLMRLDTEQAAALGLPEGTEAVRKTLIQGEEQDGMLIPYRLAETFYPISLIRDLGHEEWIEQCLADSKFNIVQKIKEVTGRKVAFADSELLTRFASEEEQKLLNITYQTPIIEHRRLSYDSQEREMLIMFSKIIYKASAFTFSFSYEIS